MMDEVDYALKDFKCGDTINISEIFNDLSVEILCLSFFGKDFFDYSGSCNYLMKNGETKVI